MSHVEYLGFRVLNLDYAEARENFKEGSVLTISPNSYGITTKSSALEIALKNAGLLVLDGVYFGLGYFLRTGRTIHKNQGPAIFYQELEIQKVRRGKVFFLGSTNDTLERIVKRMEREYPEISVACYSPPFVQKLSWENNCDIELRVNEFDPDVIFVGMTCPKQEIWVHENIKSFPGKLIMAIGGVFDWFAGNYPELHPFWWKMRLGWLGRAVQRPELVRRNMPNYWIYCKHMLWK